MNKLDITKPYIFWGIIFFVILCFVFIFNQLQIMPSETIEQSNFQKHSFDDSDKSMGTYDFPDINVDLEPENKGLFQKILNNDTNILLVLLLVYSIGLSMLFTYRERVRSLREKQNEKIRIEKEQNQSKINIYANIEQELEKYKALLTPEFNFEDLDKKIEKDVKYILFASRVVLEKILLRICANNNLSEDTLNDMIYILFKKRILDPQTNGYAHTIKAFGNYAAHPNKNTQIIFSSKDALLVLSTLITLLNALDSKQLIRMNKNV